MKENLEMDVAYLLRSLEQALRAGYSLRQAVDRVSQDIAGLEALVEDLRNERPIDVSFGDWAAGRAEPDVGLVVGAVRLQLEDGGNLADKFGLLHRVLERR